jgi:hypothetical protein
MVFFPKLRKTILLPGSGKAAQTNSGTLLFSGQMSQPHYRGKQERIG